MSINTSGLSTATIITQTEALAKSSANKKSTFKQDGLLSHEDASTALTELNKKGSAGTLSEADKKLQTALKSMVSHPNIFTGSGGKEGIDWGNAQQLDAKIKNVGSDDEESEIPSTEDPNPASSSSSTGSKGDLFAGGKEGLGVGETSSNGDGSNLDQTKASWYYNWSPNASDKVDDPNATFIPMIWGKGNMNDKDLAAAKNSKSPMILTFNEPDHGEQAKMSVDEALGYWDKLEATGKKLSSPAVTNGPDGVKWLDEFMSKAKASGKQVDSISLHWYGSSSQPTNEKVAALKSYIEDVHKKYPDKPINLTEFGVDASGLTAGKDQAFLTAAEKMLNGLDYVQMYAPYGTGNINGN